MTTETDWRAEEHEDGTWTVLQYEPISGRWPLSLVDCLTEEKARLIAAAPAKAALCEELADALEGLLTETVEALEWVSNEFRPGESPPTPLDEQPSIVQARAALKAAGRAPQ